MSVLCYHSVEDGWDSPLAISPSLFEQQCAWLSQHRQVVHVEDAVEQMRAWRRLPRGVAAMTFDDGFASLYDNAWRILRKCRIPATIFIVAQTLAKGGYAVDWVDTPPPFEMRTLTLDQVLEMQDGGVAFGSHTLTHRDLRELSDADCERDLRESKQMLEDLLGRSMPLLAYPRGFHNDRVQRCAERAGYRYAFALPTSPETPGPYAIPRVGIWPGNSLRTLALKTSPRYVTMRTTRLFDPVRRLLSK